MLKQIYEKGIDLNEITEYLSGNNFSYLNRIKSQGIQNFLIKLSKEAFPNKINKITFSPSIYNDVQKSHLKELHQYKDREEISKNKGLGTFKCTGYGTFLLDISTDLLEGEIEIEYNHNTVKIHAPNYPFMLNTVNSNFKEVIDEIANLITTDLFLLEITRTYRIYKIINEGFLNLERANDMCAEIVIPKDDYNEFIKTTRVWNIGDGISGEIDEEGYTGTLWGAEIYVDPDETEVKFLRSSFSESVVQESTTTESEFESKIYNEFVINDLKEQVILKNNQLIEKNKKLIAKNKIIEDLETFIKEITIMSLIKKKIKGFFS